MYRKGEALEPFSFSILKRGLRQASLFIIGKFRQEGSHEQTVMKLSLTGLATFQQFNINSYKVVPDVLGYWQSANG